MEVKRLDRSEYDMWNDFVETSPQESIYNYSWYLDSLGVYYDIIVFFKNEIIAAGIILAKNQLKLNGNPVLFKYGGILFSNQESSTYKAESERRRIIEALLESKYLKSTKGFNYTFHPKFNDFLPFFFNGYKAEPCYTYTLDLTEGNIDSIVQKYYPRLRSKYKSALKSGYVIDFELSFDDLWNVLEHTFGKQGGKPPFNKNKLESFLEDLKKRNRQQIIGVRNKEGDLMCGAVMYYDNHTAYLPINGISDNIMPGANELLITTMIAESFKLGMKKFDFEGSMLKPIESFYRTFGGIKEMYLKIYRPSMLNMIFEYSKKMYKKIMFGK